MPKSEKGCLGRHLTDLMLRENRKTLPGILDQVLG